MYKKNMANNIKNRIIELEKWIKKNRINDLGRYTLKNLLKVSEKIYCKK